MRILVVDDHPFDRKPLARLIEALEFETHAVDAVCLETLHRNLKKNGFDLFVLGCTSQDGIAAQRETFPSIETTLKRLSDTCTGEI